MLREVADLSSGTARRERLTGTIITIMTIIAIITMIDPATRTSEPWLEHGIPLPLLPLRPWELVLAVQDPARRCSILRWLLRLSHALNVSRDHNKHLNIPMRMGYSNISGSSKPMK